MIKHTTAAARPVKTRHGHVRSFIAVLVCALSAGCALGPRSLRATRLDYNEAVKVTAEEQMLLNIVRLRYTDTPSSLAVTAIASQVEVQAGVGLVPFVVGAGDTRLLTSSSVLPSAQIAVADRPTITLTPLDDQEFTRKLFTPLPLEGVLYLSKTTWSIGTVFRLYLENLNWVSNAQTASGPTPAEPPEFAAFLRGVEALAALQARGEVVFVQEERAQALSGPLPAERVAGADVVEAAKNGHEYRRDEGGTWTLVKKSRQPVLYVHPKAVESPAMRDFARTFRLKPGLLKYDLNVESLNPFPETYPPGGVATIDLETRSLLQVLYFVSHGVEVPPEHLRRGLARATTGGTGEAFDWGQVTRGLFKVRSTATSEKPRGAHVAVRYKGAWFYIDEADQDTKSTFSLLLEVSRLELGSRNETGPAPVLTLPLGGM